MQLNQKLVEKFFAGQCTAEEARIVSKFLENNSNRETYLNSSDWEEFNSSENLSEESVDNRYVNILDRIHSKRETKIVRLKYFAYAASLILICSAGWLAYKSNQIKPAPEQDLATIKKVKPVERIATVITNTSAVKHNYTLPDGSIVELEPRSEISYLPFDQGKRDIVLKGQALFRVHKDKTKPFTVFANNLATTALGTIFKITAFKNEILTKVKLIEGKVVVKPQNELITAGIKTVYLTPGKSMIVNSETRLAFIRDFIIEAPKKLEKINITNATVTENGLEFNGTPVAGVFDLLETKLNIKISYNPKQLHNHVFTGAYEFGRDDIDSFLVQLCNMNNLGVTKTEVGYIIKKSKIKKPIGMYN